LYAFQNVKKPARVRKLFEETVNSTSGITDSLGLIIRKKPAGR
jgi:hypothetical protein